MSIRDGVRVRDGRSAEIALRPIASQADYEVVLQDALSTLAKIEMVGDALTLANKAEAARTWAKRAKLGREHINLAASLKFWAERRAGELLIEMGMNGQRAVQGDAEAQRDLLTLVDIGVSKHESSRMQKFARIPTAEFQERLAEAGSRGLISAAAVETLIERQVYRKERRAKIQRKVDAAKATGVTSRIVQADILDPAMQLGPVDAIITDPPYYGDGVNDLYYALFRVAGQSLPTGGTLAILTWQGLVPEVMEVAREWPGFRWRWMLALEWWSKRSADPANIGKTVGHASARFDAKVYSYWKPVLVWTKGESTRPFMVDVLHSDTADMEAHEHEAFGKLVKAFTEPGQVVGDPFVGTGRVAAAALAEGRSFLGSDKDPRRDLR